LNGRNEIIEIGKSKERKRERERERDKARTVETYGFQWTRRKSTF